MSWLVKAKMLNGLVKIVNIIMKKLIVFALCLSAMVACNQGKKSDDTAVMQLRDSLDRVIEQKDNEINDMMSTMNAEDRVSVARKGEGESMKERIQENMTFIQQTMRQNRELINKLRSQLRQSSVKGDQLRRTLDNLQKQLEEKDSQMKQLMAELQAKDIHITELTEQVSDLSENVKELREDTKQKAATISSQDKELHTAWFVFGTRRELKEQGILEDGEVLKGNFNKEYFTKIDIRVDKEIKFYSRSAEMLTPHPASSYTLERDANRQYVLRITSPEQFWSTSKYLVVQVK